MAHSDGRGARPLAKLSPMLALETSVTRVTLECYDADTFSSEQ
jgi:hypothetical protein